jgi:hypothetical protein
MRPLNSNRKPFRTRACAAFLILPLVIADATHALANLPPARFPVTGATTEFARQTLVPQVLNARHFIGDSLSTAGRWLRWRAAMLVVGAGGVGGDDLVTSRQPNADAESPSNKESVEPEALEKEPELYGEALALHRLHHASPEKLLAILKQQKYVDAVTNVRAAGRAGTLLEWKASLGPTFGAGLVSLFRKLEGRRGTSTNTTSRQRADRPTTARVLALISASRVEGIPLADLLAQARVSVHGAHSLPNLEKLSHSDLERLEATLKDLQSKKPKQQTQRASNDIEILELPNFVDYFRRVTKEEEPVPVLRLMRFLYMHLKQNSSKPLYTPALASLFPDGTFEASEYRILIDGKEVAITQKVFARMGHLKLERIKKTSEQDPPALTAAAWGLRGASNLPVAAQIALMGALETAIFGVGVVGLGNDWIESGLVAFGFEPDLARTLTTVGVLGRSLFGAYLFAAWWHGSSAARIDRSRNRIVLQPATLKDFEVIRLWGERYLTLYAAIYLTFYAAGQPTMALLLPALIQAIVQISRNLKTKSALTASSRWFSHRESPMSQVDELRTAVERYLSSDDRPFLLNDEYLEDLLFLRRPITAKDVRRITKIHGLGQLSASSEQTMADVIERTHILGKIRNAAAKSRLEDAFRLFEEGFEEARVGWSRRPIAEIIPEFVPLAISIDARSPNTHQKTLSKLWDSLPVGKEPALSVAATAVVQAKLLQAKLYIDQTRFARATHMIADAIDLLERYPDTSHMREQAAPLMQTMVQWSWQAMTFLYSEPDVHRHDARLSEFFANHASIDAVRSQAPSLIRVRLAIARYLARLSPEERATIGAEPAVIVQQLMGFYRRHQSNAEVRKLYENIDQALVEHGLYPTAVWRSLKPETRRSFFSAAAPIMIITWPWDRVTDLSSATLCVLGLLSIAALALAQGWRPVSRPSTPRNFRLAA